MSTTTSRTGTVPAGVPSPTRPPVTARVLVGDDRTHHSRRAVEFAVREAQRRGAPLTVLSVVTESFDATRDAAVQRREHGAALADARAHVDAVVHGLRTAHPEVAVESVVLVDPRAQDVAAAVAGCGLVVVGARSARGPRAFGLESTSRSLLGRAGVPVVVVPTEGHERDAADDQPVVVVALPEGPQGVEVLRQAALEARLRGGRLRVVHSFAPYGLEGHDLAAARTLVSRHLRAAGLDPAVPVSRVLTSEPPAAAIARHADGADLVVMGSRGRLALAGLAHGSVSRSVLDDVHCPVEIVLPADVG